MTTSEGRGRLDPYVMWLVYAGSWAFIGTLTWTTAAVYFVRVAGMSPLQLVLTGTALEVGYFVFEVPTSVVADLNSRRLSLIIAAIISGVAMIITGAAPHPVVIIAAAALWGAGWTFRSGAEDAWLADEVGPETLGRAYQHGAQVSRLTGLVGIAGAVGLALIDLQLPFIVAGGCALALAGVIAAAMAEHGFRPAERQETISHLAAAVATARRGTRLVRGHAVLLLVLAITFVVGMWAEGFDRMWEAHLLLDVGLPRVGDLGDVVWFGIIGATTLILSFAVSAPLVRRVESLDQSALARYLLILHGALMVTAVGFAFASQLWLALATYWSTTVVRDLATAPFQTWLNRSISDSSVRATTLSLTTISGSAGEWAGGPMLGVVGSRWSISAALGLGALLLAPTLLLYARAAAVGAADAPVGAQADAPLR